MLFMCVCFLPIYSGRQVRWLYQPGSHNTEIVLEKRDLPQMHLIEIKLSTSSEHKGWSELEIRVNEVSVRIPPRKIALRQDS